MLQNLYLISVAVVSQLQSHHHFHPRFQYYFNLHFSLIKLYCSHNRMLDQIPSSKHPISPEHADRLTKISKQWHLLFNRRKEGKNIHNYLQTEMPPAHNQSSLKTRLLSHSLGAAILQREIKIKNNLRPRNNQKMLQISDFDDRDIRQNSHSVEMHKNSSISFQKNVKANSSQKKTPCKLTLPNHSPIKKTNPTPSSPKPSNDFIRNILKRYQDHKNTLESTIPEKCITIIKSHTPSPSPNPHSSPTKNTTSNNRSIFKKSRPPTLHPRHVSSTKQRVYFCKAETKPQHSDASIQGKGEVTHHQISPWLVREQQL